MTGSSGTAAFKTLLANFALYFDRAPRGASLETLQKFVVRTGTPFSSYLRTLWVVVANAVEQGGPLAPSAEMAIELVLIRMTQKYPMLMPTLFPGYLATREKPYDSLASMWTAFADLKQKHLACHRWQDFYPRAAGLELTRSSDCSHTGYLRCRIAVPQQSRRAASA